MSKIIDKKYLSSWGKIFLGMAIFWGVLMGLVVTIRTGTNISSAFTLSLFFGAAFGAFMTTFLGITDYVCKKKLLNRYGKIEHGVRQKREIIMRGAYDWIFRRSEEILLALGFSVLSSDIASGEIRGTSRPTFRSFGEKILVVFERSNESEIKVVVESEPKVPWTIGDYGKNFENVEEFCSRIKREST